MPIVAPLYTTVIGFVVDEEKTVKDFIHLVFSLSTFSLLFSSFTIGLKKQRSIRSAGKECLEQTETFFSTEGAGRMCLHATLHPHIKTKSDLWLMQQANKGLFQDKRKGRDVTEWD